MRSINFVVDSALLRELGERLVGRQYIALAELVKNSFDADATYVEICIRNDSIEVSDNGHGMTENDFATRWMRVGSTHKTDQMTSPGFNRRLTGSKGIGRLAVQFLASELELTSVASASRGAPDSDEQQLFALVDWETAVNAGELIHATALYEMRAPEGNRFPQGKRHGTRVILRGLKHAWNTDEFQDLAREVWFLQPPFRTLGGVTSAENDGFVVELQSTNRELVSAFEDQMARILDLYTSRIVGKLLPIGKKQAGALDQSNRPPKRYMALSLELEGQKTESYTLTVPIDGKRSCLIHSLEFELRIFTLQHRQPYGIPVHQAREYMNKWGGVHIYDAGFRVPYAGAAADWLNLELDHSHRLAQSKLLPADLQVPEGLNYLPTNSRVLGVVRIDTNQEAEVARSTNLPAGQHLQIQVSRDRLVGNEAFDQLRDAVRFGLDYYATRMAALKLEQKARQRKAGSPSALAGDIWSLLEEYEHEIPPKIAKKLRGAVDRTIEAVREQADWTKSQAGMLGALATVGSAAIALDHQLNQYLNLMEHYIGSLTELSSADPGYRDDIESVADKLQVWVRDMRATRTVFSPISDERNRTAADRFRASTLVANLVDNLRPLMRGVIVNVSEIDESLFLPYASYPSWMAIFHNLLLNAHNAVLDSDDKQVAVSSMASGVQRAIWVQDTGVGIDLEDADRMFEPMKRSLILSSERKALGYGGTGLGLTIVRMLATDIGATVGFIQPTRPFNTCFEFTWQEAL